MNPYLPPTRPTPFAGVSMKDPIVRGLYNSWQYILTFESGFHIPYDGYSEEQIRAGWAEFITCMEDHREALDEAVATPLSPLTGKIATGMRGFVIAALESARRAQGEAAP